MFYMSSGNDIPIDPDGSSSPIPDIDLSSILGNTLLIGIAIVVIAAPVVGFMAWEPVEEGNVKVVKKWGAASGTVFEPGAHFINPVSQSTVSLSTRPQAYTMSSQQGDGNRENTDDAITVLTEDGLRVDIDITIRYRVDSAEAVNFYKNYRGTDAAEQRLIRPSIRSVLRTEAGRLPVTEIYTGEGQTKLKAAAQETLQQDFNEDGLILETVQIRNVNLPQEYAQSVEQKEITKQRKQQKENELEVEKLEADRKRIEAEGQAEANRILSESLDQNVLTEKYIEKLNETDTVYIPVGGEGYPQFVRNIEGGSGQNSGQNTAQSTNSGSTNQSAA
ncbi:Regulator of protease activity HflC, stomatin/prohibitin superfamily [Haladaptatus litoreus]|uniref:Regulator of protease activity HflC, stomatin/prohibitin superfamily n=2 Tax=Haladaptatus litoreus TaxID=553468 RepID=A0A1N7BH88_9EURY|nr:Regulator of protease activity HflC, stomatin/prohibitin superfamily [Haladaptatus litoreus]